jgi:hypothetical protein
MSDVEKKRSPLRGIEAISSSALNKNNNLKI